MLEGQRFEPEGRLAQFMRVVSDFERDEVEAAVDGLLAFLDDLDGDADLEDGHDAEAITLPSNAGAPNGLRADLTDDHEPDDDGKGDRAWIEWHCRSAREQRRACESGGSVEQTEDDEDDDPAGGAADDHVGDAAWPEAMRQPDYMFGGLAGTPGDEDAEPWRTPPRWPATTVNDNDRRAA